MHRVLTLAVLLALSASAAYAAPTCTKGKLCGSSCISKDKVCHKGGASAAASDPNAPYKLDATGHCHDVKGKMATKAKCAA